ncbi:hypothetical protein ZWY2020_021089, partial [Hordeum vulgare]
MEHGKCLFWSHPRAWYISTYPILRVKATKYVWQRCNQPWSWTPPTLPSLNWKFVLCATWVYSCMALACYLIWKYEGPSSPAGNDEGVDKEEARPRIGPGVVYLEDCWKSCLDDIHPAWLLAFRLVSFLFMASVIIYDVIVDGWTVFLYYTQWTFLLVTLYFGLGSVLSVYGCYQYACKTDKSDADHGSYIIAPTEETTYNNSIKSSCLNKTHDGREIAGFWGYLFQIMFHLNVQVYALLIILQQKFGEIINDTSLPIMESWFLYIDCVSAIWFCHGDVAILLNQFPFSSSYFPRPPAAIGDP